MTEYTTFWKESTSGNSDRLWYDRYRLITGEVRGWRYASLAHETYTDEDPEDVETEFGHDMDLEQLRNLRHIIDEAISEMEGA